MRTNCPNIMGELELIGKVSAFTSWANLGSHPARCKLCGPKQQSRAAANCVLEGQCELIAQILRCMKWAHAGACAGGLQASVGKPERIGNVCMVGQCELIAQILWCMKWAHVRACTQGPPGLCGLTRAHQQGQCIHIVGQPRQPSHWL